MENKKISARRSIRGDIDSNYLSELEKNIMTKSRNRQRSADKMKSSSITDSKSLDSNPTSLESKSIYPNLPADDKMISSSTTDSQSLDSNPTSPESKSIYPNLSDDDDFSDNEFDGTSETDGKKKKKRTDPQGKKNVKVTQRNEKTSQPKLSENANSQNYMILILILAVITAMVSNYALGGYSTDPTDSGFNITTAMDSLAKAHTSQLASTWERLTVGIKDVKAHSTPTVFLLVHSGSDDSSNQIAIAAGDIASKYLRSAQENHSLILTAKDFHDMKDHGELNTKYKEALEASGSMVVLDLESTPGKIAQGLRYYCDEYNPLIKSAAIFLTVNLKKCNADLEKFHKGSEEAANGIAEKCLMNSWSKELGPNILQPLSIRIMGVVLKIMPEN